MLAVVEIGGNQFIVRKDDEIEVKKQDVAVGKKMSVEAMLISDEEGKETKIGTPMIEWSKVEFKVLEQTSGKKVRVFKMKAKKRQMKNKWFKPQITVLKVTAIA